MNNHEALIALNMIDHVGPIRIRHLLERFTDAPSILSASEPELRQVDGVGPETASAIVSWEDEVDLPAEIRRAQDFGCRILTTHDEDYPALLREIYDPPIVLYVLGTLSPRDKQGIALVGSRQITPYGLDTARRLAHQLSYAGITVVSGGARGVDTAAHQGALAAKGRTLAVLGTGINLVFPAENAGLFQRIASQGAVITQFPFGRTADKQTFPIRNRIVAGMTVGTVVVEANVSSGALITAHFATDYGRQVFAVPGRVDSPRSKGCHALIKKGAKLCEDVEDILTEFEYLYPASNKPPSPAETGILPGLDFNDEERRILQSLAAGEQPIDQIIRASGLPAAKVSATLFALEMKRQVTQLPGKHFILNTNADRS